MPAITASIISEPKLWSFGWRRKGRRFSMSEKLVTPRGLVQFATLRKSRDSQMRQPTSGKARFRGKLPAR